MILDLGNEFVRTMASRAHGSSDLAPVPDSAAEGVVETPTAVFDRELFSLVGRGALLAQEVDFEGVLCRVHPLQGDERHAELRAGDLVRIFRKCRKDLLTYDASIEAPMRLIASAEQSGLSGPLLRYLATSAGFHDVTVTDSLDAMSASQGPEIDGFLELGSSSFRALSRLGEPSLHVAGGQLFKSMLVEMLLKTAKLQLSAHSPGAELPMGHITRLASKMIEALGSGQGGVVMDAELRGEPVRFVLTAQWCRVRLVELVRPLLEGPLARANQISVAGPLARVSGVLEAFAHAHPGEAQVIASGGGPFGLLRMIHSASPSAPSGGPSETSSGTLCMVVQDASTKALDRLIDLEGPERTAQRTLDGLMEAVIDLVVVDESGRRRLGKFDLRSEFAGVALSRIRLSVGVGPNGDVELNVHSDDSGLQVRRSTHLCLLGHPWELQQQIHRAVLQPIHS